MVDLVPEEAIEASTRVVIRYKRSRARSDRIAREAVEAAAPLIVAAWLDDRVKRMDDDAAGVDREDRWDRGWHAGWGAAAGALRAEAGLLRASVLRGEGDRDAE